jgi:hypothetical protein
MEAHTMKRDMDLIRAILLEVEAWPIDRRSTSVEIPGHDAQVISYHVMLLDEAGLLKGMDASGMGNIEWLVDRLTWSGHEFVEAARDDTRWRKALNTIGEKSGAVLFEIVKQVLVQLAREAVFGQGS